MESVPQSTKEKNKNKVKLLVSFNEKKTKKIRKKERMKEKSSKTPLVKTLVSWKLSGILTYWPNFELFQYLVRYVF